MSIFKYHEFCRRIARLASSFEPADRSVNLDTLGSADFVTEESDDIPEVADSYTTEKPDTTTTAGTSDGMSVLQKALFFAVITGGVFAYVKLSKVTEIDRQILEKSLA
jgi:uncharacterized membrane protein